MNPSEYKEVKTNLQILLVLQILQVFIFFSVIYLVLIDTNLILVFGLTVIYVYTHYETIKVRNELLN